MTGLRSDSARSEKLVREIFGSAGVGVDGKNPGDIRVLNDGFYGRLIREASIGLGESYMDGWWECEELDLFMGGDRPRSRRIRASGVTL